jgi:hypothetical protein
MSCWVIQLPIANTVRARLCKLQKSALDSQPQVKLTSCFSMIGGNLVEIRIPNEEQTENFFGILILTRLGRWLSPDTLASSTTKTGRHDIAELLLKVALNIKNQS